MEIMLLMFGVALACLAGLAVLWCLRLGFKLVVATVRGIGNAMARAEERRQLDCVHNAIRECFEAYAPILLKRRVELVFRDDYGKENRVRWFCELQYFMRTVVFTDERVQDQIMRLKSPPDIWGLTAAWCLMADSVLGVPQKGSSTDDLQRFDREWRSLKVRVER